jgi:hypothetical protein
MFDKEKPGHWEPAARLPAIGRPTQEQVLDAMRKVVVYNWSDEMDDFNEQPSEDHIYLALRVLNAHLGHQGSTGGEHK